MRVVEDGKMGTHAWGYNCFDLSLGDINTDTWSSRLAVRRKADDLAVKRNYCCEIQRSENWMQYDRIFGYG
jgi:hypothetical protein